jgi:hypothetical protein
MFRRSLTKAGLIFYFCPMQGKACRATITSPTTIPLLAITKPMKAKKGTSKGHVADKRYGTFSRRFLRNSINFEIEGV